MNNKPILLDSLYICMGGGRVLLDFLVANMLDRKMNFVLLKDVRCPKLSCEERVERIVNMVASIRERKTYYKAHRDDFSFVLCFGNIPAPVKMSCKVFTYVHNVNILKIPVDFPFKRKFLNWLKQRFIASLASNTDGWIVQTSNTEACLREALPYKGKLLLLLPFYHIPECFKKQKDNKVGRDGYILVGDYTGTRGHEELLGAMQILKQKGLIPRLHLTVSKDNPFVREIVQAIGEGIRIENHGIMPFVQLAEVYGQCKATVYPSINESLGLGLIEAVEAGCDVIVSDLPFAHAICKPSELFVRRASEEIADAIMRYEKGVSPKSELTIHNCIEELLDLMTENC